MCAGLDVEAVSGDLTDLAPSRAAAPFAAILCVGDTLTHLDTSRADVNELIDDAARLLAPGGALLLEYREQPATMSANDSVFTVRSDRDRIMQCVLHFEPDRVWVTDVVHEWNGEAWQTIKSTYPKLRLSTGALIATRKRRGLASRH